MHLVNSKMLILPQPMYVYMQMHTSTHRTPAPTLIPFASEHHMRSSSPQTINHNWHVGNSLQTTSKRNSSVSVKPSKQPTIGIIYYSIH